MIGDVVEISIPEGKYDYLVTKVEPRGLLIQPRDRFADPSLLIKRSLIKDNEWQVDRFGREHSVLISPLKIKTPLDYQREIVEPGKDRLRSYLGGMSREQLEASGLVALLHITYDIENIIKAGKVDHRLSLSREGIPVVGGLAGAYFEGPTVERSAYGQRQFPGIYAFPYSQVDFLDENFAELEQHISLILPLSLLEQRNWHLNTHDNYGSINNITFTPETLPMYLGRLMGLWGYHRCGYKGQDICDPELILHDAVPLDFVEVIIVNTEESKSRVESLLQGRQIPVRVRSKELGLEFASRKFYRGEDRLNPAPPQYCYTGALGTDPEDVITANDVEGFSGENPYTLRNLEGIELSSIPDEDAYVWQRRLDLCGIKEQYSPEKEEELFSLIEDRMQQLYFQNAPRIPVKKEENPPWKYTPEYYSR